MFARLVTCEGRLLVPLGSCRRTSRQWPLGHHSKKKSPVFLNSHASSRFLLVLPTSSQIWTKQKVSLIEMWNYWVGVPFAYVREMRLTLVGIQHWYSVIYWKYTANIPRIYWGDIHVLRIYYWEYTENILRIYWEYTENIVTWKLSTVYFS